MEEVGEMIETNRIINGDALTSLKELPNESINMIMTSPPYWALRDYGIDGQLGLEPHFQEYLNKLCEIFDEVKRVLKKDGTCWVNLGDTYSNSGEKKDGDSKNSIIKAHREGHAKKGTKLKNYPPKCLCMIPFRFAIEMQNRGWILRNTIIWHKPNCMPSSVKDRFTVDFEYLFFFVKNKKYWFKKQYEIFESNEYDRNRMANARIEYGGKWAKESGGAIKNQRAFVAGGREGRNKRTVWSITTHPFPESHFATYPEELCEIPIKAGCPKNGIVLDPFFGSGTTGLIALKQDKGFIGIELNPKYVKIAQERLRPYLEQTKLINFSQDGNETDDVSLSVPTNRRISQTNTVHEYKNHLDTILT